jgi:Galactose oxidase, central domain
MTTPRSNHTATLLPNGRVLLAGGTDGPSAELYDPGTGQFTRTGDMSTGGGGGILLQSGKVLFLGGELYDPSTGAFTPTGHMTWNTSDTATLLLDGRVLVTRGAPEDFPPFLAEVYDPATGTFSPTGKMVIAHTQPTATLLANGKVLIAGGDWGDGDGASYVAELYDPATGTFSLTGRMIIGREQDAASVLPDGTVLLAGAHEVADRAASAEIYDPVKGIFNSTRSMAGAWELHTATLLNDGRVLIAGGDNEVYWSSQTILASAELYIPPPPDSWQAAISAMKAATGADSFNFWQWAYDWQALPAFPGAPAGFGVAGSISPAVMEQIIVAGGGDGFHMVSAEQWVLNYRQVTQPPDAFQQAVTAMKAAAGTDNLNFWQWAWYWQYLPTFPGAPAGFGVVGSISTDVMGEIIYWGGGDGSRILSVEQWLLYYRLVVCTGC